jgi:serine/threonine-protein kinase RsbW
VGADLGNLAEVREFVMEMSSLSGLGDTAAKEMRLAVDEAMANIVLHGYRGSPGEIEVDAQSEPQRLVIRLRDDAPAYNPLDRAAPALDLPLEERPIGGMGVQLVRQSVDTVEHRVTDTGGNELTLVKRRA